jgi:hypothetical protein
MISKQQFDEVFLPGIIRECQFLDHSIYYLDGPSALRHLDSHLAIPELDALLRVFGAGNEGFHTGVRVYQKAQSAGKGIQVNCSLDEIGLIMETLRLDFERALVWLQAQAGQAAEEQLPAPRTQGPAGSVGSAGPQTGIFSVDSPGGWRLIGWTPLRLFDPR